VFEGGASCSTIYALGNGRAEGCMPEFAHTVKQLQVQHIGRHCSVFWVVGGGGGGGNGNMAEVHFKAVYTPLGKPLQARP
jgi:hypothetical protein